jgi:hypothetical protein
MDALSIKEEVMMISYVNIWVMDIVKGAPKRLVAWGAGSNLAEGNDNLVNLHGLDYYVCCRAAGYR